MAIPCIALYYRHITIFQRDCCIYERVPFCTTTYCNFLSDIHWLNDIEPLIALFSFSLCMCNMFCFLSHSWMKFLRYAYIYIYISYRWDLAATSLAYIWYFDATSVKKTHSHSPPLSRKGDCESALFALLFTHSLFCFDICIDWQEEKQMTRLNSLHPSLGAWKTKNKQKKQQKKQKNKKNQRHAPNAYSL